MKVGGHYFRVRDAGGARMLLARPGRGSRHLDMIIGIVCSDNDAGRAALENIRAGREHADGYVWYGPVTHHFESDPGFVAFRARWEKQHGQPLDIRQVWGLMAQWIPGATFIRHEDLRLIVDKAVEVRFGGNKEAVDA